MDTGIDECVAVCGQIRPWSKSMSTMARITKRDWTHTVLDWAKSCDSIEADPHCSPRTWTHSVDQCRIRLRGG